MCASYRGLNNITHPFEYPIGHYYAAIEDLCDTAGTLFCICDKAQGYRQIGVKSDDQQKLAFLGPDGLKYTFKVMPFGKINAPSFYTAMIWTFQDAWILLFCLEYNGQNIEFNHSDTS